MNVLRYFILVFTTFILFVSCQKELSLEQGLAVGTLKEDATGFCLPSSVIGIFKEDTLLNNTTYIELQIDITETGTYIIKSDTINGYSFYGAGIVESPGLNTVRLFAKGTPVGPGINTFTISFDASTCSIDIPVVSVGIPAVYTLGGAGSTCTGVVVNGVYMAAVPMNATNTVMLDVNVTSTGSYNLSTPVVNGISFSASGDFNATGPQTVSLNGNGTPITEGDVNFSLSGNSGSCTFTVSIGAAPSMAVYTLGGAGSSCTGFVSSGTYTSGISLDASNTVTVDVNVTVIGDYQISTTQVNGVSFNTIGSFTTTGPQTVTFTGSGVPASPGATNYTVNGQTDNCTFSINYAPGASPAAYTLNGAPGNCTVATVGGTYNVGTALTASNTVTIEVNVTTIGAYTISTTVVNGINFTNSGTFSTTGTNQVILVGSGTPIAAGTSVFTPQGGTSGCTFSITVTGSGADVFSCKINNVFTSFIDNAAGIYNTNPSDLSMEGSVNEATSPEFLQIEIDKESFGPGTAVTPGTYTNAGSAPNQYILIVFYIDNANTGWFPRSVLTGSTITDPFTVTITSVTATRVTGTFSGTVSDVDTRLLTKTITEGVFDLPIQ